MATSASRVPALCHPAEPFVSHVHLLMHCASSPPPTFSFRNFLQKISSRPVQWTSYSRSFWLHQAGHGYASDWSRWTRRCRCHAVQDANHCDIGLRGPLTWTQKGTQFWAAPSWRLLLANLSGKPEQSAAVHTFFGDLNSYVGELLLFFSHPRHLVWTADSRLV